MAFQSAPGCAEAVINCSNGNKSMVNVMNFHKTDDTYFPADLDALAALIDGLVGTVYLPTMHAGMIYQNTLVRGLQDEEDYVVTNGDSTGDGTATGTALPPNTTYCVTLRTIHTGRTARGRFYALPTTVLSLVNDRRFDTSYTDQIDAFVSGVADGAVDIGWNLIVLSRFSGGVKRPEATFNVVTAVVSRNQLVDSQRGRLAIGH